MGDGDFARIGDSLVIMGELLCEASDLRAGQRVLDVATGGGNTAISAPMIPVPRTATLPFTIETPSIHECSYTEI